MARVLVAPDGHLIRANRAFHAFLGSRPHDLEGRHFRSLTHPDDLEAARLAVSRLLDGVESSCRMQKRYLRLDGSVVWGDVHLTLVRDEGSGAPRMFVFDVVEITQQKGEERVLRAGRELAVQLASACSLAEGLRLCVLAGIQAAGLDCGGAYVVDEAGGEVRFVCWEHVPPELLRRISVFAPDSPVAKLVQGLEATFAPAGVVDAASGSSFAATGFRAVALLPVRHETRVIAALGFASRTEGFPQQAREVLLLFAAQAGGALARLRAEDAARASDARVRHMAEHIKDGLIVIESDRVVYANQRMCEITGRTAEELVAGCPWELAPLEERQRLRALGQPPLHLDELEYWILRPDGSRRFVSTRHSRAEGDGRNYLITTDLTERRHLEQQLLHAQKMEAIGRLAGGVAHDFNNVLTVIESCAATVQEALPEGSSLGNETAEIRRAASRAAALTRQLLAFGRRSAVEPTVVDANIVIAEMERMFRRVVGEDIELETMLRSRRPCIRVDVGQLEQVLTNLVLNARDALPGGGLLTVETRDVEVDADMAARHPDATAGSFVVISVRDDGVGMSPDVLAHVFEPFYTTKRPGQGSGLGLATVYGVVTQTRGFIVVSSREGEGSSFDVYLPHCPEVATRAIQHAAGGVVAGHMRSILVVEDEDAVRKVVARTLEQNGFRVVAVGTPRDGLAEVARREERFDLVLTDVLLPVMSGPQMVAELRRADPALKVLFMSGYAETGIPEGALLLPKPFRAAELLRKVQQAME